MVARTAADLVPPEWGPAPSTTLKVMVNRSRLGLPVARQVDRQTRSVGAST